MKSMSENIFNEDARLLLKNARVITLDGVRESCGVLVVGSRITHVGKDDAGIYANLASFDLAGLTLWPGFVDLHNHGAAGVDVNEADADALIRASRFLAGRGVTGWMPTLVPAHADEYVRAARVVTEVMRRQDARDEASVAARALGLHYEGPFVNERQCGALRTQFFRIFRSLEELDALAMVEAGGARHLITLAPEIEGGIELVKELVRRGWIVSIGHTRAQTDTLEAAREAGARHMTHFMNAMPQLHHREPGPVGWGLVRDDVTVDVIADGVHLNPVALDLIVRAKSFDRIALISDSVAPAGLGDGEFRLWGETIRVLSRRTSNERGGIAGSVITMHDAVLLMLSLGYAEHEVARAASLNPARLLGLAHETGSIEEGKRADIVALDSDGSVRLTLVGGRVAYDGLSG